MNKRIFFGGGVIVFLGLFAFLGFRYYPSFFPPKENSDSLKNFTATVVKVVDGDTIEIASSKNQVVKTGSKEEQITIRYIGIDTPELHRVQGTAPEYGSGGTDDQCFAKEATDINRLLTENQEVRVELDVNEMDRFGRYLAYVFRPINGEEIMINEHLLAEGAGKFFLDTVNLKYQNRLIAAANTAHEEKKGLWLMCAEKPEIGCVVKGNYDRRGHRWYHLPPFRAHNQTVVNLDEGDQWFCTEQEAIEVGFKKARE